MKTTVKKRWVMEVTTDKIDDDGTIIEQEIRITSGLPVIVRCNKSEKDYNRIVGYVLTNKWTHFLTLNTLVGDACYDELFLAFWRTFRRYIQRHDMNAKILMIPERKKNGSLFFHVFMHTTHGFPIKPICEDGVLQKSKNGDCLFEFLGWHFGFGTTVLFSEENLEDNNIEVLYYLIKHITRQNVDGLRNRYYRTNNLDSKDDN